MSRAVAVAVFVAIALCPTRAAAQSFSVLATFERGPRLPAGRLLQVADGVFYGISEQGGTHDMGTVFVLYRDGAGAWKTLTLHSFNGADGASPIRGLTVGSDGYLYGVTSDGGAFQQGTLFKISPFGGLTTLLSLPSGANAPQRFVARLVSRPDGRLWGTACARQGQSNAGTIFSISTAGAVRVEHVLADGTCPASLVHAPDGNLYGTSFLGSTGNVFRFTPGVVTSIQSFLGQPLGDLIVASDGALYGVFLLDVPLPFGGGLTQSTIFGVRTNGEPTLSNTALQRIDSAPVEVSPGVFYGTTNGIGIYRVAVTGSPAGEYAMIATLDPAVSTGGITQLVKDPAAPVAYGLGRKMFDAASNAEIGHGTAYAVDLAGTATQLSAFTTAGPLVPLGALIQIDQSLYGASCAGGRFERGTIYNLNASGVALLHTFGPGDGTCPTNIVQGADGRIYGATLDGKVFAVALSGEFTVLHALPPAGNPRRVADALIAASDGNLWGLWDDGVGQSLMYRVTTGGIVTTFPMPAELGTAGAGLVEATDGLFHGSSYSAAADVGSRLFRATPGGSFTLNHSFPARHFVAGPLLQASDGQLYGSLTATATGAVGSIFRSSLTGSVTTVHQFTRAEGASPISAPTELLSGTLAGVTFGDPFGPPPTYGTVFSVTTGGTLTTLHRFSGGDGKHPYGRLLRGSDGAIYGTTTGGGPRGGGVIFRIQP